MKRFPKADSFIDPPKPGPKPKMAGDEIFAAMRRWTKTPAPPDARPLPTRTRRTRHGR